MTKSAKGTRSKPAGRCIFCSQFGLSKEHIWPAWLQKVLPPTDRHTNFRGTGTWALPDTYVIVPEFEKLQGDLGSKKLRIVCQSCNGGWMSDLQQRVKPVLLPLIRGDPATLNLAAQRLLSAWVAMTVMVFEMDDKRHAAIPAAERTWFWQQSEPRSAPPNWLIWLGPYSGETWKNHRVHHGLTAVPDPVPKAFEPRPNVQLTTMTFGGLLVHAFSSTEDRIVDQYRYWWGLPRIWPTNGEIQWPPNYVLNDENADRICNHFWLKMMIKRTRSTSWFQRDDLKDPGI